MSENNYVVVVNETLEKYLESNKRITAPDLYELVKDKLEPLCDLFDFKLWTSQFFRQSPDYISTKGRFGGIRLRMSDDPSPEIPTPKAAKAVADEDESAEEDEPDFTPATVMLDSTTRIHATDTRNWTLQKLTGDTWMSRSYYSTLADACKGAAKKMLNKELRATLDKPVQLQDLAKILTGIETKIANSIKEKLV